MVNAPESPAALPARSQRTDIVPALALGIVRPLLLITAIPYG